MIRKNPNNSGRNNSLGLPKVSSGQPLHPKVINRLSDGVEKSTIKSVDGFIIQQSNGGTTLRKDGKADTSYPWKVSVTKSYVTICVGNCISYGTTLADVRQYYPQYDVSGDEALIIPRGGELTLDPNVAWKGTDGKKVESTKERYAKTVATENLEEDAVVWIDAWGSGMLKYTVKDEFSASMGVPIAYIFADNSVIQIISSTIFIQRPRPFQISAFKENGSFYIRLTPGFVNNQIPKYKGGGEITDLNQKLILTNTTTNAGAYIFLKCKRSGEAEFPVSVEVVELGDTEAAANSEEAGHICVGRVLFSDKGGLHISQVFNFLNGSVWAETHKFSQSTPAYFYYAV